MLEADRRNAAMLACQLAQVAEGLGGPSLDPKL